MGEKNNLGLRGLKTFPDEFNYQRDFRNCDCMPGLREGLQSAGYHLARTYGPYQELWLKPSCDPTRRTSAAGAPAGSLR